VVNSGASESGSSGSGGSGGSGGEMTHTFGVHRPMSGLQEVTQSERTLESEAEKVSYASAYVSACQCLRIC
jgi:hypothetical protein